MRRMATAMALIAAAAAAPASAQTGGTGFRPHSLTLDARPPEASPAGIPSCQVPAEYMRRVQTGDTARMGELFAENATIVLYTGTIFRGREQIQAFFNRLTGHTTDAVAFSFTGVPGRCLLEMAGRHDPANPTGPYTLSVDTFVLDEHNKITDLIIYIVPPPRPAAN